jgi:hypothetical protein
VAVTAEVYHEDLLQLERSRELLIVEVIAALDEGLPEDMVAKCAAVDKLQVRKWRRERVAKARASTL